MEAFAFTGEMGNWEDCIERRARDVLFATSDNRQIHSDMTMALILLIGPNR